MQKPKIREIDLFVTHRCNLKCRYCYHKQKDLDLDEETAIAIVKKLATEICPEQVSINFWGGEPFLKGDIILKVMEEVSKYYGEKQRGFQIITNGTIYDEELLKKMFEYFPRIQISLDGREETHNKKRGLWKETVENLKKFKVNFRTSVRATVSPDTVHNLVGDMLFIRDLGITEIMHQADIDANWNELALKTYYAQLEELYKIMVRRPDLGVNFISRGLRTCEGLDWWGTTFCGAGRELIAIDVNGDVYPCHRACSNSIFKLGNVFKGKIIRGLFLNTDKITAGCVQNCPHWKFCHTCMIAHYFKNGKLDAPVQDYCKYIAVEHYLAEKYFPIYKEYRREDLLVSIGKAVSDLYDEIQELKQRLEELNGKNKSENIFGSVSEGKS